MHLEEFLLEVLSSLSAWTAYGIKSPLNCGTHSFSINRRFFGGVGAGVCMRVCQRIECKARLANQGQLLLPAMN